MYGNEKEKSDKKVFLGIRTIIVRIKKLLCPKKIKENTQHCRSKRKSEETYEKKSLITEFESRKCKDFQKEKTE